MTGWVRSSACAAGDCIEARRSSASEHILIRRNHSGMIMGAVVVTRAEWDAFTAGIKNGEFDQLGDTP